MGNAKVSPLERSRESIGSEASRDISDQQLLRRFVAHRDETAFAGLVQRHSGTVWSVCRRVLGHQQAAEDAFQAAFLILARKARSVRKQEAVGSWLYGVAYRTAMRARRTEARRQHSEKRAVGAAPVSPPWADAACRELQLLLDEELQRLAEKHRAPFVLCCLEGMSRAEAARELGCKEGTVASRLGKARAQLQRRLLRRGVALSAALTALAGSQSTAAASPVLVHATVSAVLAPLSGKVVAASASPAALALAESSLRAMVLTKLRTGILFLVLTTLAAGGALAGVMVVWQTPAAPIEAEALLPPRAPPAAALDERVLTVAFSPDGKKLVTAGGRHLQPGQLIIWDVTAAKKLVSIQGVPGIRTTAFSPDGRTLACGDFEGFIRLRDPHTGAKRAELKGHRFGVNSVAFSADSSLLASAGLDQTVKLWDLRTLQEKKVFLGHADWVLSVAFFRTGKTIVTGGKDGVAKIWDIDAGTEKFTLRGHQSEVEAVAVSPDDKVVATGSWDQSIKLWDAETGRETGTLEEQGSAVMFVTFSPDGQLLASALDNGAIRLWDMKTRKVVGKLEGHVLSTWGLAFSRDGKYLASGSFDKTAKVWDVAAAKAVATLATSEVKPVLIRQARGQVQFAPGE